MFTAIFGSVELGIMYGIMALGVYISFRILDFPDLTVDGSFVTGASVSAVLIINGVNPFLASLAAIIAGFFAGCITGILNTKGKINPLLSGILMMIALYSINLRIMGKSNIPLLQDDTIITMLTNAWQKTGIDDVFTSMFESMGVGDDAPRTWGVLFCVAILVIVVKLLLDVFLKTEIGLALRATGDNKTMLASLAGDTDRYIILGLGLANGLVALSGSIVAQYGGFSDIGMGIGMIVAGLASVIIGEALFGTKTIARTTFAVVGGAVIYRIIIALALRVGFLETGDMKLITAVIVMIALIAPRIINTQKEKRRKKTYTSDGKRGDTLA